MQKSKIEWCTHTWSPVTGCLNNCPYCYARKIAQRFGGHSHDKNMQPIGLKCEIGLQTLDEPLYNKQAGKLTKAPFPWFFTPTFHKYRLDEPVKRKKPANIFVCSMADLFGEWVLIGEGIATVKFDGSCCMIQDGELYKRHDVKKGRKAPEGFIPAQEPDTVTGHWPGWVKCDRNNKSDKWFWAAFDNTTDKPDGTYEAIGPHFQGNAERREQDILVRHGSVVLDDVPRDFDGLKMYLGGKYIEGIVFHRGNGDVAKVKRTDFGFGWNGRHDRKRDKQIKGGSNNVR